MEKMVELVDIEIWRCCMLNCETGEREIYKKKRIEGFTGLFFLDENNFFAIYPTINGPIMYYKEKEYLLNKDLHIKVEKYGEWREFSIKEYDINIRYKTSKYIGFDVWSEEEDVDLFYQIEQNYKKQEYYDKYTK